MPRVAVCFSGLPRAVFTTYTSLKEKIFGPLDPDIFGYFWEEDAETRGNQISHLGGKTYSDEIKYLDVLYNHWKVKEIKAIPKPACLLDELFAAHAFSKDQRAAVRRDKRRNALSMFKAIYEANQMKCEYERRNRMKYDYVVRARTDISLRGRFQIVDPKGQIIIPHIYGNEYDGGYSDVLAWGSSEAMDYYSEVYNNFYNLQAPLWDQTTELGKGLWWNAHVILKAHLDKGKYPVHTFGTDLRRRRS